MTPEEKAWQAMQIVFGAAGFDKPAYDDIRQSMSNAIRSAVAEEREECARIAESKAIGMTAAKAIRLRGEK